MGPFGGSHANVSTIHGLYMDRVMEYREKAGYTMHGFMQFMMFNLNCYYAC